MHVQNTAAVFPTRFNNFIVQPEVKTGTEQTPITVVSARDRSNSENNRPQPILPLLVVILGVLKNTFEKERCQATEAGFAKQCAWNT